MGEVRKLEFPKQMKDVVYALLQEPTLEKFREFLHSQLGEHNSIDFKGQWIEGPSLAKEILALANSQGGIIIFGVAENEDKSTRIDGLSEIRDKAVVSNDIKNFISSDLKYEVYDFSYTTSEYEVLNGRHFQMLVVEDTPERIPFLAKRESGSLKQNMIYVRRGTSCEIANEEELVHIIDRRINHMYPNNGSPLKLDKHLSQLKDLYNAIEPMTQQRSSSIGGSWSIISSVFKGLFSPYEEVPNAAYPEESYDDFVAKMILEKKKKIERILDLH